jgi:hypothetical protein
MNIENKEENIFNLSLDLFHLKLNKKKFFLKDEKFKPHLIHLMKKKIALLKKIETDRLKEKKRF